jgi:hypothetical protein
MALATLSIDLEARLAKLDEGFSRAQREAEKSSAAIAKSFERLNGVAATLGATFAGVFSVGAIGQWLSTTADGLDALNDAADATGASFEKLSGLEGLAARTGTSFDTVTSILIKFNSQLTAAGDANSGAAQALRAIGLEAEQLRSLDPADALKQTADALSQFADDGTKARLVQELFGKSVKDAAPFLKDLAEAGELNARNTKEQADEAERFKRAVAGLQADLADVGRTIASEVFPWISRMVAEARDGISVFGGLGAALRSLAFESADYAKGAQAAIADIDALQADIAKNQQRIDNPDLLDRVFGLGNIQNYVKAKEAELAEAQKRLTYFMRRQSATDPQSQSNDALAGALAAQGGPAQERYLQGLLNRQIDGFDAALGTGGKGGTPRTPKRDVPKGIQSQELDGLLASSLTKQLEALDRDLAKVDQLEQRRLAEIQAAGADLQAATERVNVGLITSDRARGEAQIELERRYAQSRLDELEATADERRALEDNLANYIAARQAQLTEQLKPEWQRMLEAWNDTTTLMAKSFDDLMGGIVARGEDALTQFIKTGKLSVSGLVDFVQEQIARLIAQQAIAGIANFASLMTTGFAKGGVFNGGAVTPFATGGVVNSPTYFPMTGGRTGLMGEAGPEAIMPLARDRNGRLGVRGGGGGGPSITLNIASGVSRAELAAMLPTLQAQIEASLIGRSRRPGSVL